ncbi:MAG: AMP-binding protein [Sinobacteraceae bacterium]|nr:AMP-binding protein [Nevskiaceae bacterium]
MTTLSKALQRHARRRSSRTALVSKAGHRSYAELDARVNQTANALMAAGLGKSDRLALMSPNTENFVFTYYAAMRLGLVFVPVNPRMAAPEVQYLLEDSGARAFIFDSSLAAVALAGCAKAAPGPELVLAADATDAHDSLAIRANAAPTTAPQVEVSASDDAEILYTSGTTGKPKGVLLDQHRVTWVAVNMCTGVGMRDGESMLHVAPLYHSAELNLFLNGGLLIGARHVLLESFEPGEVLATMERERTSAFFGVPTMYQFMLRHPDFAKRDLSAWRIGMFGAAPMPPATIDALAKAVPDVVLYNLCGPSEAGPGGIVLGGEDLARYPGANGWAFLNTEVRVVDDADHDVKAGETGEILLRGETIMKGYWNKPEATAKALRNGWLHTGDVGRIDVDGCITLVDRKKDMIITGGMNVYSVEVENALASHPDILDCAVVGLPHPDYGESIVAVVTPREGAKLTLAGVRKHAMQFIADYKAPQRLVMGEVPRNPSGKIIKHQLRKALKNNSASN